MKRAITAAAIVAFVATFQFGSAVLAEPLACCAVRSYLTAALSFEPAVSLTR